MSGIIVQVQVFDVIMLMSRALIGRSKDRRGRAQNMRTLTDSNATDPAS